MRSFYHLILAVVFFLTSSQLFSEHQSNSSLLERIGSGKKRPPVTDKLSDDEILFLTENFFRVEESLKDRYDNKTAKPELLIPEGITSALSEAPRETILAAALADLAGSLNKQQTQALRETSEALASKIREQEPADRDLRLLAIIERSEWLTYIIKGETPPASSLPQPKDEQSFQLFKKEFQEARKEVNKRNREILDHIEEAKGGNGDAKQWLRSHLDMKSLTTFLKGQKDFGGDALFEDVAEAMVWEDKDQGIRYHDFTNKTGQVARLIVGKEPAKHAKQLAGAIRKNGGRLADFSISPTRLSPKESEIINVSEKPLPKISLASKALPIFKQSCADCHRNQGIPISSFANAADLVRSGEMPKGQSLSEADKKTLIDFFQSNEPKEPFLQLIQ